MAATTIVIKEAPDPVKAGTEQFARDAQDPFEGVRGVTTSPKSV
jgi:hypothetical protein